jgi:transaldolase
MSLASLLATGTKVWLDGFEPDELEKNRAWGVTGATSNPAVVSKIIGRGGFDDQIAWALDDVLVAAAQEVFRPAWERAAGDDGCVSFELDPLVEDEGRRAG